MTHTLTVSNHLETKVSTFRAKIPIYLRQAAEPYAPGPQKIRSESSTKKFPGRSTVQLVVFHHYACRFPFGTHIQSPILEFFEDGLLFWGRSVAGTRKTASVRVRRGVGRPRNGSQHGRAVGVALLIFAENCSDVLPCRLLRNLPRMTGIGYCGCRTVFSQRGERARMARLRG